MARESRMRLSRCAGQSGSLTEASEGAGTSEEVVSNCSAPTCSGHVSHAGQVRLQGLPLQA